MHEPLPLIEAFRKDLYHCADCNYCVDAVWAERGIDHVCPTIQHHSPRMSYSGRGFLAAARAWHEGVPLDLDELADRVFTCTTCGNCEQTCPIGLRPTQVGRALRGELWARGHVPSAIQRFEAQLRTDGNPNGVAREMRMAWQREALTPAGGERVLYLPGCAAATAHPEEARAVCAIFTAAGCTVATLGPDDSCCGAPWYELGRDADAAGMLDVLAAKASSAETIVISGLECARSWRRRAGGPQPVTFVGWLAGALRAGRVRFVARADAPRRVRVLDSCQVRQDETPGGDLRAILDAVGVEIIAPGTSPRHVVCCGAAGGMPQVEPAAAQRMAAGRALEDDRTAAPLVGADPRCIAHLRTAMPAVSALSLAEFLVTCFDVVA